MRVLAGFGILVAAAVMATACQPAANEPAAPAHATYDARTFYDTTAISMADGAGYAFSADGSKILLANDSSGVFNAASIPVAGGGPAALTTSPDNATFAVSYFPADDRILVAADQGGNELDSCLCPRSGWNAKGPHPRRQAQGRLPRLER